MTDGTTKPVIFIRYSHKDRAAMGRAEVPAGGAAAHVPSAGEQRRPFADRGRGYFKPYERFTSSARRITHGTIPTDTT